MNATSSTMKLQRQFTLVTLTEDDSFVALVPSPPEESEDYIVESPGSSESSATAGFPAEAPPSLEGREPLQEPDLSKCTIMCHPGDALYRRIRPTLEGIIKNLFETALRTDYGPGWGRVVVNNDIYYCNFHGTMLYDLVRKVKMVFGVCTCSVSGRYIGTDIELSDSDVVRFNSVGVGGTKKKREKKIKAGSMKMMPVSTMVGHPKLVGSGDYKTIVNDIKNAMKPVIKTALTGVGGYAGGALGNMVGAGNEGKTIGSKVGAYLSKLFGSGDYTTNDVPVCNSLLTGAGAKANAQLSAYASIKAFPLQHREYVCDVYTGPTAGGFTSQTFSVQPGLATFLPWGSNMAQMFEEYRVKGMVMQYIPSSSPYNSNSAMGTVFMAMQYNSAAAPFTNKISLENSDFAISDRIDKPMAYGIECVGFSRDHYYVRNGASTLPLVDTDIGLFQIAVLPATTFPVDTVIGELWVAYDIEFIRARLGPERYGYAHVQYVGTLPIGAAASETITYGSLNGLTTSVATAGQIKFSFPQLTVGDIIVVTCFCESASAITIGQATSTNFSNDGTAFNYLAPTIIVNAACSTGAAFLTALVVAAQNPGQVPSVTYSVTGGVASDTFDFIFTDVASGVPI